MKAVNRRTGELVSQIEMAGRFTFRGQTHFSSPQHPLVIVVDAHSRCVVSCLVASVDYSTHPHDVARAMWGLVDVRNEEQR